MLPTSLIPYRRTIVACAIGALVVVAGAAVWTVQGWRLGLKGAKTEIKQQAAVIQTQVVYRVSAEQRQEIVNEVEAKFKAVVAKSELAAAGARSDADRVRKLLADRSAGSPAVAASAPIGADDPATVREVLRSCVAEYQSLGKDADGPADQLTGLQEYAVRMVENQKALAKQVAELTAAP